MAFTAARLTLARERRGLNKTQLAQAIGVSARMVSSYETGEYEPGEETLARIVTTLDFPAKFFAMPEPERIQQEAVSFRSLTSMTASQRDAAIGAGRIAIDLLRWIVGQFTLPGVDIPELRGIEPEEAATIVRERWGIGVRPIRSMVHLLELHGVRVFSLAEKAREVDAFSFWHGDTPMCFLNTLKSVEHSRFDAAHELGHLVLHRHGGPTGRAAEHEADLFASSLLMPRSTVRAEIAMGAGLTTLIAAKSTWGVSAAALAYRCHKIGKLSDWHYRSLCIEMGQRGYRVNEPQPIVNRETSQVLHKVFAALKDEKTTRADIAKEIGIYPADLDTLVFGLVMTSLDGGALANDKPSTLPPAPPTGPRPPVQLRLVKG